jgi:hypothetical protein
MTIRLAAEFGAVLAGRSSAARLRARIEEATDRGESVVLDFADVLAVSPSFADELFAKIDSDLHSSGRLDFQNLGRGTESIAKFVVAGRRGPLPA